MESDRIHARAVIMREGIDREDAAHAEGGWLTWLTDCGIPALSGVDTRALVRHIRDKGAMRGGVFAAESAEAEAHGARRWRSRPMTGADFAREVTPARAGHPRGRRAARGRDRHRHQGLDRAQPARRGVRLELHPCDMSRGGAAGAAARTPSSSPTAPATPRRSTTSSTRSAAWSGKVPVWGICLGHQLLCRAVGLETFKLPFGHRGANHPVKDLETGRIEITSQNHGFAVLGPGGERTHRHR